MIVLKLNGIYHTGGQMVFGTNQMIEWNDINPGKPPELPNGSSIDITISFYESDFLSGKNGIVWATYELRQAEIIKNSLLAQHISSEVQQIDFMEDVMFILKIDNETDISTAIDFIWRDDGGLRLKPDWTYSEGETNKSFELWLSGR